LSRPARAAPSPTGKAQPALDALPRALTAGEQKVIGAANDFSFALFRRLSAAQPDSNVFTVAPQCVDGLGWR
jgi:hypothetical protein